MGHNFLGAGMTAQTRHKPDRRGQKQLHAQDPRPIQAELWGRGEGGEGGLRKQINTEKKAAGAPPH